MGKKKGKKDKKEKAKKEPDPNALTEVDKTFYELQIADLNRKLARLRTTSEELEVKNEELRESIKTLDEDRNDVIIFLKRILQEKSDEMNELQERFTALEETKNEDTIKFEEEKKEMEAEYKTMHETLTSEIKLLDGKLNSLEEFRIHRDELMKKFEEQENRMEEQEKRHKRELYDIERKFIIAKDNLKKDMEARLLQLSTEFNDATELRIAATTHRVIRENVAINNELDLMLVTHNRLHAENEECKERERKFRQEMELREVEKNRAIAKVKVQTRIIERLTKEHEKMQGRLEEYKNIEKELNSALSKLNQANTDIFSLQHTIRLLEQNLHASRVERASLSQDYQYAKEEVNKLTIILRKSAWVIKKNLAIKRAAEEEIGEEEELRDEAEIFAQRESLLHSLLELLNEIDKDRHRKPSVETVPSISETYSLGDLGFVPKPVVIRSRVPTRRHAESQVGSSFEEMLATETEISASSESRSTMSEDRYEYASEPDIVKKRLSMEKALSKTFSKISEVFFESTETSEECSEESSKEMLLQEASGTEVPARKESAPPPESAAPAAKATEEMFGEEGTWTDIEEIVGEGSMMEESLEGEQRSIFEATGSRRPSVTLETIRRSSQALAQSRSKSQAEMIGEEIARVKSSASIQKSSPSQSAIKQKSSAMLEAMMQRPEQDKRKSSVTIQEALDEERKQSILKSKTSVSRSKSAVSFKLEQNEGNEGASPS